MATTKKRPTKKRPTKKRKPPVRKARPPMAAADPVPADSDPLTFDERRFVSSYLINDENATRAWKELHPNNSYGSASVLGSEMARREHVAREIEAAKKAMCQKLHLDAQNILLELVRIGLADPALLVDANGVSRSLRDIPIHTRRAISKVKISRERVIRKGKIEIRESIREYQFCDKLQALDRLSSFLGMRKATVLPLDALLAMLPPEVADLIRGFIRASATKQLADGTAAVTTLPMAQIGPRPEEQRQRADTMRREADPTPATTTPATIDTTPSVK